jgi:hypothetical protein
MDDLSVSNSENNDYPYPLVDDFADNNLKVEGSEAADREKAKSLTSYENDNLEQYGVTPQSFMEMDLNALLIQDKLASYLYRAGEDNIEFVQKDSMLLVDRSLQHQVGDIVVIGVDGNILLRRFVKLFHPLRRCLIPALITDREGESPIFLHPDYAEVHFKGVVRCIIHFCRPCQ